MEGQGVNQETHEWTQLTQPAARASGDQSEPRISVWYRFNHFVGQGLIFFFFYTYVLSLFIVLQVLSLRDEEEMFQNIMKGNSLNPPQVHTRISLYSL